MARRKAKESVVTETRASDPKHITLIARNEFTAARVQITKPEAIRLAAALLRFATERW